MSGKRNEPARARRRTRVKEVLSLTSVPKSEEDSVTASQKWTLDNHFGWVVLQKSQIGDGFFPHLFQYYEKPDLHGRDFDKVTYVLYMDKGTVVDKRTTQMGTQTAVSGVLVAETPLTSTEYDGRTRDHIYEREIIQHVRPRVVTVTPEPGYYGQPRDQHIYEREIVEHGKPRVVGVTPGPQVMHEYKPERRKKKKIISEFYYVRRDRSRSGSRSPKDIYKGGYSDADSEKHHPTSNLSLSTLSPSGHDVFMLEKNAMNEKDRTQLEWQRSKVEIADAINSSKKDHHADGYQLRAGAEKMEREYIELKEKYERTSEMVKRKSSKVKCKPDKYGVAEELLKTSSGTNQYLYVSGKKRLR